MRRSVLEPPIGERCLLLSEAVSEHPESSSASVFHFRAKNSQARGRRFGRSEICIRPRYYTCRKPLRPAEHCSSL